MESLNGKKAIVTGGTRGIGRAIAERLLREGAAVAICGRDAESTARAAAAMKPLGNIYGHAADITRPEEVRVLFDSVHQVFSGIDILVNNAGVGAFRRIGEMTVEEWRRNIDVNLNGAFYCSREALARFGAAGFIVNISSLAGKNAFSGGGGYNAAKAGLNLFSEAMMLDHRYDGVRVCSVMPGSVDTEFSGDAARHGEDASWKISPQDVAEIVAMVLRMPLRTTVSRVEVRPSRPKK
jgi:NAD(P)-dependent dehydrogenase (short-subunit alcohol dehydrogenase family)